MTNGVDQKVLDQLIGKAVGDVASAMGVFMAYLGDQAGVYSAMDEVGPSTVEKLSSKTGLNPKYLREWLGANAAAGYVTYDKGTERFSISEEQALVFTREGQPACVQGFFQAVVSQYESHVKAVETFRSGKGGLGANSQVAASAPRIAFSAPAIR
jgi:hypothetical protein